MLKSLWLTIALVFLAPSAYCFSYSTSTDGAGYSAQVDASDEESLVAVSALDGGGLSNTISGKGALHENHFVSGQGNLAQVRADLINAENYTYSYRLVPSSMAAPGVQASESLDVSRAVYIRAAATAASPGLFSTVSTEVIDGSISGYSNNAYASGERATASQKLDAASGHVLTDSISRHMVDGSWKTSQVATYVQGALTKYNDNATSMIVPDLADYADVTESSHIIGSFTSRVIDDNGSAIRTSNFGTEFDLARHAWTGYAAMGGSTDDYQGYYVRPGEKIQDAINSALPGDTINVASGTYLENLAVAKNLNINGQGAESTVVNGSKAGTVISITSPCTITNLKIQNGNADYGGGVSIKDVAGTVTLKNCIISNNYATQLGGGISFRGNTLMMNDCSISGNSANGGGGVFIWKGGANILGCVCVS